MDCKGEEREREGEVEADEKLGSFQKIRAD